MKTGKDPGWLRWALALAWFGILMWLPASPAWPNGKHKHEENGHAAQPGKPQPDREKAHGENGKGDHAEETEPPGH
ncbi:MAG: hypothetical protein ACE5JS_10385, partial [Nitrospinota bacterium]